MKKFLCALTAVFAATMMSSCSTGGKSLMSSIPVLIPSSTEQAFGVQVAGQTLEDYRASTNRKLISYVSNLGAKLVNVCDRQDIAYTFYLLQTNMINAFAAPGGYIFVTTGIMKFMDNEAQLAAVIGHELGHVTARHSMKALQMQFGYNVLMGVLMGGETNATLMNQVANAGVSLLFLKNSRDNEYESDNLGTKYAFKAGYDPYEMSTFLGKLAALEESSGRTPEFLSTHPLSENRLIEVETFSKQLAGSNRPPKGLTLGKDRYLAIKKLLPR